MTSTRSIGFVTTGLGGSGNTSRAHEKQCSSRQHDKDHSHCHLQVASLLLLLAAGPTSRLHDNPLSLSSLSTTLLSKIVSGNPPPFYGEMTK